MLERFFSTFSRRERSKSGTEERLSSMDDGVEELDEAHIEEDPRDAHDRKMFELHGLSDERKERNVKEQAPQQKAILKEYWSLPLTPVSSEAALRASYDGTQASMDRLIDVRRATRDEWRALARCIEAVAGIEDVAWRVPPTRQALADERMITEEVHSPFDIPGYLPVDLVFFRLNPSLATDLAKRMAKVVDGLRATQWIDERFGRETPEGIVYPTPPQRTEEREEYGAFLSRHPDISEHEAPPTFDDDWDRPQRVSLPGSEDEQAA